MWFITNAHFNAVNLDAINDKLRHDFQFVHKNVMWRSIVLFFFALNADN
jgi:hypothetical protein